MGVVKSVQTGYFDYSSGFSTGSGEDSEYIDIAISSIVPSKTHVYASYGSSFTTIRPVSNTAIRVSGRTGLSYPSGRWYAVEYY